MLSVSSRGGRGEERGHRAGKIRCPIPVGARTRRHSRLTTV